MCSSISRVHVDLWKEPGTDDPYRAIFHVFHSEVASSVSRNRQNPVRLRRFNKDDLSKLFFNGVVGSWDDFKVTTFDQQRETLAGLCSYETFSLEGPVLTFRLIAKASLSSFSYLAGSSGSVFLMRQSIQMLLLCWTSLNEMEHFIGRLLRIISLRIVTGNTTLEHSTRLYLWRGSVVEVSLTYACKLTLLIVHCDTSSAGKSLAWPLLFPKQRFSAFLCFVMLLWVH